MGCTCGNNFSKENTNGAHSLHQLLQNTFEVDYIQQIKHICNELKIDWNENSILVDQTAPQIASYLYERYISNNHQLTTDIDKSIFSSLYLNCKKYIIENQLKFETKIIQPKHFYYLSTTQRGPESNFRPCKFSSKFEYGMFNKIYCIRKTIQLNNIRNIDSTNAYETEIKCLIELSQYPFIINLYYVLTDKTNIYLIYDYIAGGDLKYHLNHLQKFTVAQSKFYAAQILLALKYIHSKGIIYRDLKLENVLLNKNGYIKLCDFTLAKKLKDEKINQEIKTVEECIILYWTRNIINFCQMFPTDLLELILKFKGRTDVIKGYAGTPGYVSPESILAKYYDQSTDLFSFGVLMYRFLSGMKPFADRIKVRRTASKSTRPKKAAMLDRNCVEKTVEYPSRYFDMESRNLIKGLLCKNVRLRIGNYENSNIDEIFQHPFFDNVNWYEIENQIFIAPFVPIVDDFSDDIESRKSVHVGEDEDRARDNIYNKGQKIVQNNCDDMYYVYDQHLEDYVMETLLHVVAENAEKFDTVLN